MGNEPKVGAIATLVAHIMMMGHGSQWGGGDRDIAVTREMEFGETAGAESVSWNLTSARAPFYELPPYVNDLPPLSEYVDDVDRADGALDGRWRDNDIQQLADGFDTPARTPFQETLIETVIEREGFDVYRQDFNCNPLPYWRDHDAPERAGLTENRHVVGYLKFWDALLATPSA